MNSPNLQNFKVPTGLPTARFRERPVVSVPAGTELPLIDKTAPPDKRIQEVWNARVKVFNLGDDTQRQEYAAVWQNVCSGKAMVSEHRTDFHEGSYTALLRWADLEYKLPT